MNNLRPAHKPLAGFNLSILLVVVCFGCICRNPAAAGTSWSLLSRISKRTFQEENFPTEKCSEGVENLWIVCRDCLVRDRCWLVIVVLPVSRAALLELAFWLKVSWLGGADCGRGPEGRRLPYEEII